MENMTHYQAAREELEIALTQFAAEVGTLTMHKFDPALASSVSDAWLEALFEDDIYPRLEAIVDGLMDTMAAATRIAVERGLAAMRRIGLS